MVIDVNGSIVHVKMGGNVDHVFVENVLINQNVLVQMDSKVQCVRHQCQQNGQQRLQDLELQQQELPHQELLHQEQLHQNKQDQHVHHGQTSPHNGDHGQLGLNVTTGLVMLFIFHFRFKTD